MAKYAVVLYFTEKMAPSAEEYKDAEKYGPGVRFRNVRFVHDGDAIEPADQYAGKVPPAYVDASRKSGKAKEARADEISRGARPAPINKVDEPKPQSTGDGWGTGRAAVK